MSSVQVRIDRAHRLLGLLNSGSSATTQESTDALIALNAMLDSWRNDKLMCYAMRDQSVTLSSGDTSKTVGASGDLNTDRPVEIQSAYVVYNAVSIPVKIITDDEWAYMPDKTATSTFPGVMNYKATMSTGTILFYPIPNATSVLHILTRVPVTAFAAVSTEVTLPPGWEEAIDYNLAVAIAPEFDTEPSRIVMSKAQSSLAMIKRMNVKPAKAYSDLNLLFGGGGGSILTNGL